MNFYDYENDYQTPVLNSPDITENFEGEPTVTEEIIF